MERSLLNFSFGASWQEKNNATSDIDKSSPRDADSAKSIAKGPIEVAEDKVNEAMDEWETAKNQAPVSHQGVAKAWRVACQRKVELTEAKIDSAKAGRELGKSELMLKKLMLKKARAFALVKLVEAEFDCWRIGIDAASREKDADEVGSEYKNLKALRPVLSDRLASAKAAFEVLKQEVEVERNQSVPKPNTGLRAFIRGGLGRLAKCLSSGARTILNWIRLGGAAQQGKSEGAAALAGKAERTQVFDASCLVLPNNASFRSTAQAVAFHSPGKAQV